MSRKDCLKVQVLSRVKEKMITVRRAGELPGLSERQAKRLLLSVMANDPPRPLN